MAQTNPIAIVEGWQDAANRQDLDALLALSDPQIELVGPRGSGYGHQLLRDWLDRAGASFETQRVFARDTTVVVAQHGVWRSAETGAVIGEQALASRFRVENERVTQFQRYDNLDAALADAGLTADDAVERS